MKFCPQCGNQIKEGQSFCNKCGSDLKVLNNIERINYMKVRHLKKQKVAIYFIRNTYSSYFNFWRFNILFLFVKPEMVRVRK